MDSIYMFEEILPWWSKVGMILFYPLFAIVTTLLLTQLGQWFKL